MPTIESISGGISFEPWFGLSPSVLGEPTIYGSSISTISKSDWVSEKERIEELLLSGCVLLPPPQINMQAFQIIAREFQNFFNINLVTSAGGLATFGITESALTLAALAAWAESQHYTESDLVKALLSGKNVNPFEVALKQFIAQGTFKGTEALSLQLLMRQLAVLQAALKTAPEDLIHKGFLLAQQEIIIAFLQKWSEMLDKLAALQREDMRKREILYAEKMEEILSDFIKRGELNRQAIRQPFLSILIGALVIDAPMMASIIAMIPAIRPQAISSIPSEFTPELGALASGFIASVLMWAAPIAMTIARYSPGISDWQMRRDAASSFALTLATVLTNPGSDALLHSTLSQAVARGRITESQAITISATFKASMLISAMAILYSSQTGGVTAGELKGIITGEVAVGETDFCGVLARLVREQLDKLDIKVRGKLLDELVASFDENPPIDDILGPLTCFINGWNPQCITDSALSKPA